MAEQHLPDGRSVYLHCSSIFNGPNACVRKAKKISQLLWEHRTSIEALTDEFTLEAIAVVAKELLEARLFGSLPRAKLRVPELLLPPSGSQEPVRTASEAEIIETHAEAAQDTVLITDNEGGDFEQGGQWAGRHAILGDKVTVGHSSLTKSIEQWQVWVLRIPQAHC